MRLARATVVGAGELAFRSDGQRRAAAHERHQPRRHHRRGARGADGGRRAGAAAGAGGGGGGTAITRAGLSRRAAAGRRSNARRMSRWPRRARPIWSSWRSSCWRSAAGSASPSPSWRAGPSCRWPQVYAELPDRAALLRVLGRRLDARDAGHRHGRARRDEPARAGVRADHAPARRHGALQGGPAHPRAQGRARTHAAGRGLLQSRPAQPAPARRGRDRRRPGHDTSGAACDGGGLSAGVSGLARRRHAGHGAHPGRARPPPAAGGDSSPLVRRLRRFCPRAAKAQAAA